ncbi:beta strand repeat-containing protein [Verrucomicrobium spinosum]|uniref:beta strand repeat-containing protein n=3 Tax=Verrucomicrobium spinosum TaxID=2736 RepID=UPI0009D6CC14|nr:autotransporter-associated beta strand repeat-containing protein [Verrucomicrobium spinosum]
MNCRRSYNVTPFSKPGFFVMLKAAAIWAGMVLVDMDNCSRAAEGTWTQTGDGSWGVSGNWSGSVPGGAAGDVAKVIANIGGNRTITLDVPVTLGQLQLGDTNNSNYYVLGVRGGANALTFDNMGAWAVIDHRTGSGISPNNSDRIDADVVLQDSLTILANRSLELRGTWTGNGNDVTVDFGSNDSGALVNFNRTGTPTQVVAGIGTLRVVGDGEVRISGSGNVLGANLLVVGDGSISSGLRVRPIFRFERTDTTQTAGIQLNAGHLIFTTNAGATPQVFSGDLEIVTGSSNILQLGNAGNDRISRITGALLGGGLVTKLDTGRLQLQGHGSGFDGELRIARGTNNDNANASVLLSGANGTLNGAGTIISTERDGSLWIDDRGSANTDRLSDDGEIRLGGLGLNHRSQLRYYGNASGSTETMGTLVFTYGAAGFGTAESAGGVNVLLDGVEIQQNAAAQFTVYGSNQSFGTTAGALVANTVTMRLNNAPTAGTGAGQVSHGVMVGAFGGAERYQMGLINAGREDEYPWVARDLMMVDATSQPGQLFLRPMTASDYNNKTVSSPTHAFTEDMALHAGNVLASDNVRLTGGFGLDTITAASQTRWDSVYRVTEDLTFNSLVFAQDYTTGVSNPADLTANDQDGNRVLFELAPNTTVNLTSGMIVFGATGDYNSNSGNLNIQQFIRGGTIDAGTSDFYLHHSAVWLRSSNNTLSSSYTEGFIDSVLAGSGDLIKTGAGTIYLQAANTYTGATIVHQGTLVLRDPLAIQNSTGVLVDGLGNFGLSGGIHVSGQKQITVGLLSSSVSALQSYSGHNTWDGDFVVNNVDSAGLASLHSARIAASSDTTLTMYGDIYGDPSGISSDTNITDPQLISTYNSGNGILNLKGVFKDTAAGAVAGAVGSSNENTVTRFQIGGAEDLNVNIYQQWEAQGRIYLERGYMRLMSGITGDFWTAGITPSSSSGFAGLQMGGSGSTGGSNLALMLTTAGQVFNLDSWGVGGDSTNQTGNSMLGGENETGTVTFGRGTGSITLNNRSTPGDPAGGSGASVIQTYNRDLRIYANAGGNVDIAARVNDGGSMVNSTISKIGRGSARLLGSTAGASTVEGLNVMDGRLVLDYSANNNNRVTNTNALTSMEVLNGGSGYAVGNVITVAGGGGASFRARVSSVDGTGAITGIIIENQGQGFTGDPTSIAVAQGSASTATGTGAQLLAVRGTPLQMGGGVLEMVGNGAAATVQDIAGLRLLAGASEIVITSQAGQSATLNLGSVGNGTMSVSRVQRHRGGVLNFVLAGAGSASISLSGNNVSSGFLGAWATYGEGSGEATSWAALNGTLVEAFTDYVANVLATGNHTDVTTDLLLGGDASTSTLRFNDGLQRALDLGGHLLTMEQGGILVTSSQSGDVDLSNGTLTSAWENDAGGNDLVIHQYGGGVFKVGAQIVDDAVNGRAVTLVTAGSGIIDLSGNSLGNTYTGGTVLNRSTVVISQENQLGAAPAAVSADNLWFHGGTLRSMENVTLSANRGILIGGGGATFEVDAGKALRIDGVLASETNVVAGYSASHMWGDITKTGGGTLELFNGNANNTFAGHLDVQEGIVAVLSNADDVLGTNRNYLDGTTIRSGGVLLLNAPANDQISREWLVMDGGTLRVDLSGGNWQYSLGGMVTFNQDSTIEVASGDTLYMNRFGGTMEGAGSLIKTGRGSVQLMENSVDFTGQIVVLEGSIWNRSLADGYGTLDGTPGSKGQAILLGNDGVVTSVNNGEVNIGFSVNNGGSNGSFLGTSSSVGSSSNAAAVDAFSQDYYINNDIIVRLEGAGSTSNQNKRLRIYGHTYNGQTYKINGDIYLNDDLLIAPNQSDSETLTMGERAHIELNGDLYGDRNLQLYVEQNGNVTDPDNSFYALYKLSGDNSAYTGKLIVGGNSDAHVRVYARPLSAEALPSLIDLETNGYLDLRLAMPGTGSKTITLADLDTETGITTGRIIVDMSDTGAEFNLVAYNLTNQNYDSVLTDLNIAAAPAYDDQDPTTAINAAAGVTNLIKDGPGYLRINNASNSYSGYTLVRGGTLLLEHNQAMGVFNASDLSTQTFVNVDPETLTPIPGATGSIDLRGRDFRPSDALTEIFHISGMGDRGLGALRNTTGTSNVGHIIVYGDASIGGSSTGTMTRHTSGSNEVAAILDMGGAGNSLSKIGANEWRFHNVDIRNRTGATLNIYEGEVKFENNGALGGGGLIDGTTYGNNLDGLTINVVYNRKPYDGLDPANGTRTYDPLNPPSIHTGTTGNAVIDSRLSFGTYWGNHAANTKVTDFFDNFTVNLNNGTWQREGHGETGRTFDQIFGTGVVINLTGGGIGRDAAGNGNLFDMQGGASGYNSTLGVFDHPGITEIQGVFDNTSSGNNGTGFTVRGSRELRLTGDSVAFDGDILIKQSTGRWITNSFDRANGGQAASQYTNMSLAGANGSMRNAGSITLTRWGSLALLNGDANNDDRLNDGGFMNLRNGYLLLNTHATETNRENLGHVVADIGTNYLYVDTTAGGKFDGSFQTFTRNNGGVLKIYATDPADTFGGGAGDDVRIKVEDTTGLVTVGSGAAGTSTTNVVVGVFGTVIPTLQTPTISSHTRPLASVQGSYMMSGGGTGLMTLDNGYLRPLTAAEFSTTPDAGSNWMVNRYISPTGGNYSDRNNYADRNVTADTVINSLSISFDAAASGQALATSAKDTVIIDGAATLKIDSGIINIISFAEANSANLEAVIRGGTLDMNGGAAIINSNTLWHDLDRDTPNWYELMTGNSSFIRSNITNVTDLVKTGRDNLYLDTWNDFTGNISVSEQSSLVVRHGGALGLGAAGREVLVGGGAAFLLEYGTNISGIDLRVTNTFQGSATVLRNEGSTHSSWGGDVILDVADAAGSSEGQSYTITARNNGTLTLYGNVYTDNNDRFSDSDAFVDPPLVTTNIGESYTLNLRGQFRDVKTGNLGTDPANAAVTSIYRTGDSETRLDANHSLRFQMTGHDEGNVNVYQQWDATGRLDLNRGYFRIMYDPAQGGFLTEGANALIQGNDYWTRAALGVDSSTNTGTYHSHLMLTKAGQVFNWANILYVYNNNRDGTLSIGGEQESGKVYIGSADGANYQIVFENQGGDRDLRFTQVRGGELVINARLLDNGSSVNAIATVSGPGTVTFNANGAGASTVERWNFTGGEAVWQGQVSDGGLLGDNRFAVSTAQALFGGGDLTLNGDTAAVARTQNMTGNVWVLNGGSMVRVNSGAGSTTNLNLGAAAATLTKRAGGTMAFVEEGAGSSNITLQATGVTGSGIMSWAVYGNSATGITDFASNGTGGAIEAYSGYTSGTVEGDYTPSANMDVAGDVAFTGAANANTLRLAAPVNLSLDGQSMTLAGGAILVTSGNTGFNSISGGTLTSAFDADLAEAGTSRDLMIHNWGTGGKLTIGATITNDGANKVNLVHGGTGTMVLTADNTYTGDTYLNGGVLEISSDGQLGDVNGGVAQLIRVNVGGSNGTANGSLTFFGGGGGSGAAGTFTANSSNQVTGVSVTSGGSGYTSGLYVNAKADGTGSAGIWAILDSGNLHFDGGTLKVTNDINLNGARTIFLGANGGTLEVAAGSTLTINGYITSEFSHINGTNGYTANHLGLSDQPASDRNPDIGDLVINGGGTVVLTGAPDGTVRANVYNSYGGITWINDGTLWLASAGSTGSGILGTHRSWVDSTVIGAEGTLMLNMTSDSTIYEWFTVRGDGYQGNGTFRTAGTVRTYNLAGQISLESDAVFNLKNGSHINLNNGGGDTFGSGDIIKIGTGEFRFYGNMPEWTGNYVSSGGNTRLYGAASLQGAQGMTLERNTYFGYGAGSTSVDEFRDRLGDNMAITTDGYVKLRMEAGAGIFSGKEKVGTLTVAGGQVGIEFDLGADLFGGAPRLQGDTAGWHFTEIVRQAGASVHLRNFDAGTSFADGSFNPATGANQAVVQVDIAPLLYGSGDGSNGNRAIAVGFFGGTRPAWIGVDGAAQRYNEEYTSNRLVTVDTNEQGEKFLRPLYDSEYREVSNPDTAQTSTIALDAQGLTADQNLKIVGVTTDSSIGVGQLTDRRNSFLTIGATPVEVNSLTFASETFADGSASGRGNFTAIYMDADGELKINSGVIQLSNTGVQNFNGAAWADRNLDIRSAINGGSVNFNGQEAHFSVGGLWAHYNSSDSLNAYRGSDGDNNYLFMNSSIRNANGLTKTGQASLILAARNYYTGTTSVNQGALYARHDNALGFSDRVVISGSGTLVIGFGARVADTDLYIGKISGNNTALQIENNSFWAGDVILDNVDSAGAAGYGRNFTPRIFNNTTGTGTIQGNIYGGPTAIATGPGLTDSRMFSTYTGAAGLFDLRGRISDTVSGSIGGPITELNQSQLLRMEVVATTNEASVQLWQSYDTAGRIRLLQGGLFYQGTGDFYTAAAAASANSNPLNPMVGLQMGGRSVMSGDGETAGDNLGFFLVNAGSNFNLKSWEVGVETYDPLNLTGNDNYGRGNTTGNSTMGGLNLEGEVVFGTGEGTVTLTQSTRQTSAYDRDLRLLAVNGGTATFNVSFVDGGSNVNSSITKIGGGVVNLAGSSAGAGSVESVHVMGGILNLTNYGEHNNRRVGAGAGLLLAGGTLVMDASGASFTENFGGLAVRQGGSGLVAAGNGAGNFGTLLIGGASIDRSNNGTLHFQSIGGGVIQFTNGGMASITRLGSYATFGANASATPYASAWAATDASGQVIAYTHAPGEVDQFGAGLNTDVTTDHELSGATEAASLRFNTNTGSITTDGGVHTLSLSDGGILFTSDYGTGAAFDSNVSLTTAAAATDLVIHNFATGMVNFNAGITGAQNVIFSGAGTLTLGGTNNYTGATHINGNSIVAFDSVARFGATSEFYLNGGTLRYTGSGTSTAITQHITLGGGNGIIDVSDAGGRLIFRGSAINQFSSETNNVISSYGANNPNNGGLVIVGAGTVQFGDRSMSAITSDDFLGIRNNYTGLTVLGDGVNALRVDIQGQPNDGNYDATVFGANESWADATVIRNNVTMEFSSRRGDGARDGQVRFLEWFQIGEKEGDQITFDGTTQRQPTFDGVLNVVGDLTFIARGNLYADAGGTGNSEFLINPNQGGIYGTGNIIKKGDGNLRFYTGLHEWSGDLDVQDGYLGLQMNGGALFHPGGKVYFGDVAGMETSAIQLRIENRFVGNSTTSIDGADIDLTFNRDIIVRDDLRQMVTIGAGYLPQSSTISFMNSIHLGSDSNNVVRFYYEDTTNLDPALVGHNQHAVFDITGSLSGNNSLLVEPNEGNNANDDHDIFFTIWLRGDNSQWTGSLLIGNDNGPVVDFDDTAVVRLGHENAIGQQTITLRNNSFLQLAGMDRTFTQDILYSGTNPWSSKVQNASETEMAVTFETNKTGVDFQDVGVGLSDGVAATRFGGGSARLNVVKQGTGITVFGFSTGGGADIDGFSDYTGTTTVAEGILTSGSNNSFSPYSRFHVQSGAELSFYFDQAEIGFDSTIGSLVGGPGALVDIDGGGTMQVGGDDTHDADYSGEITGIGNLYKVGTGTQRISGANTFYASNLAVISGTLVFGSNESLGVSDTIQLGGVQLLTVNPIDARVELLLDGTADAVTQGVMMNNFDGNDEGITLIGTRATSGSYGFAETSYVYGYGNFFAVAEGASTFSFGGSVGNNGSDEWATSITKVGAGRVELRNYNSYGNYQAAGVAIDGGTIVRHGTLALYNSDSLGTTVVEMGDKVTPLASGAYLATTGSLLTTDKGGEFDATSNGAGGAGNGAFINVKAEVDGVAVTGADIGKRILVKDEGRNPERNGVYVVTSVDPATGLMSLVRAADFDESGEMNYGTSITVAAGVTQAGGAYFMAAKDVAQVNGVDTDPVYWEKELQNPEIALLTSVDGIAIYNAVDINGTNGTGRISIGGDHTVGGSTFFGDITFQDADGVATSRELSLTSASDEENLDGGVGVVFRGAITEAVIDDILSIRKTGEGTVTLASSLNTYSGKTTVEEGTLAMLEEGTVGNSQWIEVHQGATFDTSQVTGGIYVYDHVISGNGTLRPDAGNTLQIGTDGGAGMLRPGMSSDPADPAKAGNLIGTLTVDGNLTLSGDSGGAVRLVLQLGAGAADYNDAAAFSEHLGAGDFNTWLTSADRGAFYDGLTAGNHDRLVVNGEFSIDAGGYIVVDNADSGFNPQFGDVFNLIDWADLYQNDFDFGGDLRLGGALGDLSLPTLSGGLFYDTTLLESHGVLMVVPEPGRSLLLLAASAFLLLRRRRRMHD